MQRKMRVLVTGGAGFIGSNVARLLEKEGSQVFILDNFFHANFENIIDLNAEVISADILDEGIFKKLPKIDAVIHEAAITDTTLADNTKMMMVNFVGFKNVLNFCLLRKIKLVYASSAGVYGLAESVMSESNKTTPHNTYGYSKYLCDCLTKKLIGKKNIPSLVGLRYFNVYGSGEAHKEKSASMIYQLYLQMKAGKSPRIFKYGDQKRDFIYVKDVARITIEALKSKSCNILNVGTGKARSFNEMIAIINKVLKTNLKLEYFDNPYVGNYQNFTQADTTLLKRVLKTEAKFSLDEGIENYIRSYLDV